jgi:hypothetical protein
LESAEPPDGKYLPDEPASFARSMNSSVKRNLFRLPNSGLSRCLATHAVELVGMKCTFVLGHFWYHGISKVPILRKTSRTLRRMRQRWSIWTRHGTKIEDFMRDKSQSLASNNDQVNHLESKLLPSRLRLQKMCNL